LQKFIISFAKSSKSLCVLSKYFRDIVRVVAGLKFHKKGMGVWILPCVPFILIIGSLEYGGKVGDRSGGRLIACGHEDGSG